MAARDLPVRHARDAVVADDDAPVLGIRVQARAAVDDEVERPLPLGVRQRGVRVRVADFAQQLVRREAAAERAGDEVLDEDVERRRAAATRGSMRRSAAASRAAAASTSSSACVGTTVTFEIAPG